MQKKVKKLSKFVNNQFDFILCITVLLLLALGIVMVLSASAPSSLSETGDDSYAYVRKQAIFAILGLVLMFFISKIDYRFYKKYYWTVYFVSWIILLLVAIPGIGLEVNGAKRWIDLKIVQFQPSEITKIGLIIFYAGYLADHKNELKDFFKGFVKPFLFLAPPIGILFLVQNHLSVSLVIICVTATMMLMAGCRVLHFAATGGVGLSAIIGALGVLAMTGKRWIQTRTYTNIFRSLV